MDRYETAYAYHHQGFNCAQAVLAAFADQIGVPLETALAAASGIGGGIGGSHQEVCGAISGSVMALGYLYPYTDSGNPSAKQRVYALAKEFRRRFEEAFGKTRCGELLAARPEAAPGTAAARMGITGHCDVMIVTAVEILEQLLAEQKA